MRELTRSLLAQTAGVAAIEYALIASLIAVVILSAVMGLGGATGEMWGNIGNAV